MQNMKNRKKKDRNKNPFTYMIALLLTVIMLTQEGISPFLQMGTALQTVSADEAMEVQESDAADSGQEKTAADLQEEAAGEAESQTAQGEDIPAARTTEADADNTENVVILDDQNGSSVSAVSDNGTSETTAQRELLATDGNNGVRILYDEAARLPEDAQLSFSKRNEKEIVNEFLAARDFLSVEESEVTDQWIYDMFITDGNQNGIYAPQSPVTMEIHFYDSQVMTDAQKQEFVSRVNGVRGQTIASNDLEQQFIQQRQWYLTQMHLENLQLVRLSSPMENMTFSLDDGVLTFRTDKIAPFVLMIVNDETPVEGADAVEDFFSAEPEEFVWPVQEYAEPEAVEAEVIEEEEDSVEAEVNEEEEDTLEPVAIEEKEDTVEPEIPEVDLALTDASAAERAGETDGQNVSETELAEPDVDEEDEQGEQTGTELISLTITADSDKKVYDGTALTKDSYTVTSGELVEGHHIDSVAVIGSQTDLGTSDNVPSDAVIKNAAGEDVTASYDITYVNGSLTVTWPETDSILKKELTSFNGDLATYTITVNPHAYILTGGENLTLTDTFSDGKTDPYVNQSIIYSTVSVNNDEVSYDFSGNTGTYVIPDGAAVEITYTTRVKGQVGEAVQFNNTAVLDREGLPDSFTKPTVTVTGSETISPTGSDISGTDGVYTIDLYAYADGHMEQGLEGATFRLLDSNMRPMYYLAGDNAGKPITFTTKSNGYVTIGLNEEADGLAIHKNTVYFLEMTEAPSQPVNGEYVYYQRDNTYYSFLITDNPNYTYGGIYSYYNGDTLKVRCKPETGGVNITKRFSGNYTLTDEQKNAVKFTLQKEAPAVAGGWTDVESHTYGEFSYGSINFSIGREGGTELEDFATYRVVEENALPGELNDSVEVNTSVTVSYQLNGQPVTDDYNEFEVNPDDKAFSYAFTFTNEYVDHKLTIIKINENTGVALPGATFSVYAANDPEKAIAAYVTDAESGSITIRRSDEGANYVSDTLYYAVETGAPDGYIIPKNPEKVYFYFSENSASVPAGLPSGSTATDLTKSYDTRTISNDSNKVNVPVTVVWGVNGSETWPGEVDHVVIGLYKSIDGDVAERVLDENNDPRTVTLTSSRSYDTASFTNLPATEVSDGVEKSIVYSIVEEGVYDSSNTDITSQYAYSSSISGTGWYVVKNQPAVSVVVKKQWYDLDGTTQVSDTSDKPAVTFDLYRTTTASDKTSFTHAELAAFLAIATRVRTGLTVSAPAWSMQVDSLEKTDKQGKPYYYYALEQVPDNQEDSYTVTAATESTPRTLTIKNTQTPSTVIIKADDIEMTYGDGSPVYTFTPDVHEDGSSVDVSGPDADGSYTATVKKASGDTTTISFAVSCESVGDAGTYEITLSGETSQGGYRVIFENGTLTINRAEVTITAGAEKIYGDADPSLVKIEGLKNGDTADVLNYTVSREEGEDVGEYRITLTGETLQGNYRVTYIRTDENGSAYVFTINRAPVTVTADNKTKTYGEDDPELTVSVIGLQFDDEPSVISHEVTRVTGENIGHYTITPSGDAEEGNYSVTYETGTFEIVRAPLTVAMQDAKKTYGEEDPEWEIEINGLQFADDEGQLSSTLNEETGVRTYSYSVGEDEDERTIFSFTASRQAGENVGEYTVMLSGEASQNNYSIAFSNSRLEIIRAELTVTPDHVVKAIGITSDPLLTATITGWKNGDDTCEATSSAGTGENAGVIIWTYKRDDATILTFTLSWDAGEEEGEYPITASGDEQQGNYQVSYEQGVFGVLSVLDIDIKQPLVDYADTTANPSYTYTATLDLTGTGLTEYNKEGFTAVEGVPTQTFILPDTGNSNANMKTLKVPGGAKLTVTQNTANDDYTTTMSRDGSTIESETMTCVIERVDTYHEIAYTHSRISLPVEARVTTGQTEDGAQVLAGRKGAMGIPTEEMRAIDADFADEMHSKIGYVLPTDMYYAYDHASLYTTAGTAVGASGVAEIKYDRENSKWQYRTGEGEFRDVPDDTQLVLFYLPKFVCKIDEIKFYSVKAAMDYAVANNNTSPTIEMLIPDYSVRSVSEAVTIPADYTVTITTASTEYEGTDTAVISRSMSYTGGHMFRNDGTLILDRIVLDGKGVSASDAIILNETADAVLTVDEKATLQNTHGNNGGAIYVKNGTVTVNGTLSNNEATNGGAVYVAAGTVELNSNLTNNSATYGGAVYMLAGDLTVNGNIENNNAQYGGAVYMTNGTLTVGGSMAENKANQGGAVYMSNGTLTVSGSMDKNSSTYGGAVYMTNGTLTVSGRMSENTAISGGAVYMANGTLTLAGNIAGNNAASNGGAVYMASGTLNLVAESVVSANTAVNGGAVYMTAGKYIQTGGDVTGNATTSNGGAVYGAGGSIAFSGGSIKGNKADSNGGAIYTTNAAVNVTGGSIEENQAGGNGGAIYTTSAAANVTDGSIKGNSAEGNGGAIYTTSAAITFSGGNITSNEAKISGGAIYTVSAAISVTGGNITENKAATNGGAIYSESGAVTVTSGGIKENKAVSNGGAIYMSRGSATFSGGELTGNNAINGAAIFVDTGIANISNAITGNTATNGGAVGVGSTFARLYFAGDAAISGNIMVNDSTPEEGVASNVYLDMDSDQVINVNAGTLVASNRIGIYVPGDVDGDQVVNHGDVGGNFGSYTSTTNVETVFVSDRFDDLVSKFDNSLLYWGAPLTYDVVYKAELGETEPPQAGSAYNNRGGTGYRYVTLNKIFYPHDTEGNEYVIYDLVNSMKLYDTYSSDFNASTVTGNATNGAAAAFAYAYANSQQNKFDDSLTFTDYLTAVKWDNVNRKWQFVKSDGTLADVDTADRRIVIVYSAPAYLTVTNNNTAGYKMTLDLTVNGRPVADQHYGYATARNGATVDTLLPITSGDLVLEAGESVKLLFPGAQSKSFTLKGIFGGADDSATVTYTIDGGAEQTSTGASVSITQNLKNNYAAEEIVFGNALPICKIGDVTFARLHDAVQYMVNQKAVTGETEYTIEMLVDYLIPSTDVLSIPDGYQVTFTTASRADGYTGTHDRATLSRDVGNSGSSVIVTGTTANRSTLTVTDLIFDGRSIAGNGNGGAINAHRCDLIVDNCDFKGYTAVRGGAIFATWGSVEKKVTIKNTSFTNCKTNANADKAGGGAVMVTARDLYMENCVLTDCAVALTGKAQGGAVFHNITEKNLNGTIAPDNDYTIKDENGKGYSENTHTELVGCKFYGCYALGRTAGSVESDAQHVIITRCEFYDSYSAGTCDGAGAVMVYARDQASGTQSDYPSWTELTDCVFENCQAVGSASDYIGGGAFRSTSIWTKLTNCSFKNCYASKVGGGAMVVTNANAQGLEIYGCSFENCYAEGTNSNGGAIKYAGVNLTIGDDDRVAGESKHTSFTNCSTYIDGGAVHYASTSGTVKIDNATFDNCTVRTGSGGAVYTRAVDLTVSGEYTHFKDCMAQTHGGGVYYNPDGNKITTSAFTGGLYENCKVLASNSTGGAIRAGAWSATLENLTISDCEAGMEGGGIWINPKAKSDTNPVTAIKNVTITGSSATKGGGLYVGGNGGTLYHTNLKISGCSATSQGGGMYQDKAISYMYNASINGSVSGDGGGLYVKGDGSNRIYHYSGTIEGTAGGNGGGVYFGSGIYYMQDNTVEETLPDGTVEQKTYSGAHIGSVTTDEEGNTVYTAVATGNGGGLYMNGGTLYMGAQTDNISSTVSISGQTTGNGGGLYMNGGTLYMGARIGDTSTISIMGTAGGNGGGILSKVVVYHYCGDVTGTATNGGGVYFQGNSHYHMYSGSISGQAEKDGGGFYHYSKDFNMHGGNISGQAGGNGGGVYKQSGDTYTIDGGSVSGQAGGSGGGIYQVAGTVQNGVSGTATSNGVIDGCSAANGGAVYLAGGTFNHRNSSEIKNSTASGAGGGVYVAGGTFFLYDRAIIENCSAAAADGTFTEDNLGGGIYQSNGTVYIYGNTGAKINGNKAYDGGGIYHAAGTFNLSDNNAAKSATEISNNTAQNNGGGIYHLSGTLTYRRNTNDAMILKNQAQMGGGIFCADGTTLAMSGGIIEENHALKAGGGIAVGGRNTVLNFSNIVKVMNNTMGSGANSVTCNVFLDQDSNTIINNTNTNGAMNVTSYIGVYASDAQDDEHGVSGMPFASQTNATNLNRYHNDRRPYLYGVNGGNNLIKWSTFVCKITDGEGNLLYKDTDGTPAVYEKVETVTGGAFMALNVTTTPALYQKNGEEYIQYTSNEYQVQMLVENYDLKDQQVKLDANTGNARNVMLTTASTTPDECGFKYEGDARFVATIKRTVTNKSAMVYLTNNWNFTLSNIILDGGENKANQYGGILRLYGSSTATIDSGAVLKNGWTNNQAGGAVYMDSANNVLTMKQGSSIENCNAGTGNGGGVYVNNNGTFNMEGGSITGCSANNGGGIFINNGTLNMSGGEVTGNKANQNSATDASNYGGGGINLRNTGAKAYFSGHVVVTGNTQGNGVRSNVLLAQSNTQMIYAKGLDARSEIGIYTPGAENNTRSIYYQNGRSGMPFGTWSLQDDNLFCFVNDRSTNLRGFKSANTSDTKIYWEYHPLLTVTKAVSSDWSYDQQTAEYSFTVKITGENLFDKNNTKHGDMTFNREGVATFKLKAGQSTTAILPDTFDKADYEVTEVLSEEQKQDYTVAAAKNAEEYSFTEEKSLTVTGKLGENIGTENSTSLSSVVFTNARVTGELTVTKEVTSALQQDLERDFSFKLTLADDTITKSYTAVRLQKDEDGNIIGTASTETISFVSGVARFTLKHLESLTIQGLPTDLAYTIEEELSSSQTANVRTQVSKNGSEPVSGTEQTGTIGEKSRTETVDGVEQTVYSSEVVFMNNFLDIVCKITNRSRDLLYVREANGSLHEAVFSHLEDAFAQINTGNLRTGGNGTVSGTLRIEMVVPNYTMEGTATLNSGKTVILSTALTSDTDDFPYNKGIDDGNGNISVVTRSFTDGSMIVDSGALTIDKITLDGGSTDEDEPITATADGGIVKVDGAVRLTVNSGATLQNSAVTGNGGAIYLPSGASLAMNGTIENCSAEKGGGVYADTGFTTITATGIIAGCEAAAGSGGAIYASTGSSININAGSSIRGNSAKVNGGAIYSDANLILRGTIGGTDSGESNTAGNSGGGIFMGENTTITMYSGSSISGNRSLYGGGLYAQGMARIAGGSLESNSAVSADADHPGMGGALYAAENSVVTISGTPVISGNEADQGGAVYDSGSVTMSGGSMTSNVATAKGGAVYVADGKTFTMSGGSISGNKSPEGAVSTGSDAVLMFSGNSVVYENTNSDGMAPMNVYLGYDSNSIIRTSGLGSGTNTKIGVYVADGEPEDPEIVENAVDDPIYCDHGISARNFGTYTGSSVSGARLNKFINDRDTSLTGMDGGVNGDSRSIAWAGKGLQIRVFKIEYVETEVSGDDPEWAAATEERLTPINGVSFTLTNGNTGTQVWSGRSNADGLVSIPWIGEETANGNAAHFAPGSTYILRETAANGDAVRPGGEWIFTVGRDNSVTWTYVASAKGKNQTIEIALPAGSGAKAYLGDVFGLYNDVKPTLTFDVNDGEPAVRAKLSDNTQEKTETIAFTTTETSHNYTITETNPSWDSHVFKSWATLKEKPTGENDAELSEEELIAKGYFEYSRNDEILFYRGTEDASNAPNKAKGDLTLYAQWDEVVCKVTDRDGNLLYVNGTPAVYGMLEDCFEDYNTRSFTYQNGGRATARRIEMLVEEYTLEDAVTLARGKTVTLTTAPATDTDGYAYTGAVGTSCVITRGENCNTSMITNNSNLTLMHITLDGGSRNITTDGGVVNMEQASAVLTIASGATLQNSWVEGQGGAVHTTASNASVYMTGGIIQNCRASDLGGGIYVSGSASMTLTGGEIAGNSAQNGGGIYTSSGILNLSGVKVSGNTASQNGGGLYIDGTGRAVHGAGTSTTISGNKAKNGGGLYLNSNGRYNNVAEVDFYDNTASEAGGAIYSKGILSLDGSTHIGIEDHPNKGANGGGIYVASGETTLVGSTKIQYNETTGTGGWPNGNGAGVYLASGTLAITGSADLSYNTAVGRGGALCTSGGTAYINGSATLHDNNARNGEGGGAVYLYQATLNMSSGAIENNHVLGADDNIHGQGGGVRLAQNSVFNMSGGTISGNEAATGAGIYLKEGAKLNLSGNPDFGGSGLDTAGNIVTEKNAGGEIEAAGNFSTVNLATKATNGGMTYSKARQDIYLEGTAEEGQALTSLTLTGNLNVPAGSIWVWAEGNDNTKPNHYYMLKQFAVLANTFTEDVNDKTYNAFRNARADADTDCGGDYLRGQDGDDIGSLKCVYWTGGFDFSFRKVDGFGNPLSGATFTLYTAYTSAAVNTPYLKGGEEVSATSSDGKDNEKYPDPEDDTKAQAEGTVLFSKIAPRVYYMVETAVPEGYTADTGDEITIYRLTMQSDGTATLERKLLSEEDTGYQEAYKVKIEEEQGTADRGDDQESDRYQYQVMNQSPFTREVILRKIDSNYTAIEGVRFRIFRADLSEVINSDYDTKNKGYTSLASGVYFIDELPYGTYYLVETGAPSMPIEYRGNIGKVFVLTVNEKELSVTTEAKYQVDAASRGTVDRIVQDFMDWAKMESNKSNAS